MGHSNLLVFRGIIAYTYCSRLEAEFPPPENPLVMVFKSPWTGVSCV